MTRFGARLLLAFALAVPGRIAAQQPPPSPASPPPATTPDCALFSIEGLHLGMTVAEAQAAVPALDLHDGVVMETYGSRGQSQILVHLRAGRVIQVERKYDGMSQAGVRQKFLDHFGPPTVRGEERATPASRPDLERGQSLAWRSTDCNVEVELHIESEQDYRGTGSPAASASMKHIVEPAVPATGTADVKF